jgi:hypothetical protein
MTSDRASLIGKHLLIGITRLDREGNVVEQIQTHGRIVMVNDRRIVIEKADGSGEFGIPADLANLQKAPPGEYRLRSTGEIVVNPDLTSTWTVHESVEAYKSSGSS